MAKSMREIENRYFTSITPDNIDSLINCGLKHLSTEKICQHYLAKSDGNTVRLRESIRDDQITYVLCIKGSGDGENEVEEDVSPAFARPIMNGVFNTTFIEKIRYTFELGYAGLKIEIDFFQGTLLGLVIAEIEIPNDDFIIPDYAIPSFIRYKLKGDAKKALSNYDLSLMSYADRHALITRIYNEFSEADLAKKANQS